MYMPFSISLFVAMIFSFVMASSPTHYICILPQRSPYATIFFEYFIFFIPVVSACNIKLVLERTFIVLLFHHMFIFLSFHPITPGNNG